MIREIEATENDIAKVNALAISKDTKLDNGKVIRCVKDEPKEIQCIHCYFEGGHKCHLVSCHPSERKDNEHVYFKLIENE